MATHATTFYRDTVGKWRYRIRHANGRILVDSGEGYTRRYDAVKAYENLCRAIKEGRVGMEFEE